MPTVPEHFRFVFRGIFDDTPEQWSFSCKFRNDVTAGPNAGVGDIDPEAVTAAVTELLAPAAGGLFQSNVNLVDWRAYHIDTTGHAQGDILRVEPEAGSVQGTMGLTFPPQIALVVTTVADGRGPGTLGRFFLPGPGRSLDGDSRLTEVVATAYAEAATDFLKGVSDAIDLPGTPDSSSGCNISARGAVGGTRKDIDHLEVGRAYDTLRTRRSALLEERIVHGHIDW